MSDPLSDMSDLFASHGVAGKIAVLGDFMLDRYTWGEVDRISPEAPVPVVKLIRQTEALGGAGNVAVNLAGLNADVEVVGVIGADAAGDRVRALLEESHVGSSRLGEIADRPTTVKERVMGGHQQMIRIDKEVTSPFKTTDTETIVYALQQLADEGATAITISDYAKGAVTAELCQSVIAIGCSADIPVIVDPKDVDFSKYRGATVLSPNRFELARATATDPLDQSAMRQAGEVLRRKLDIRFLVVTLGSEGIDLITDAGVEHFPAVEREVYDVSGAGDTVLAVLARGLAGGSDVVEALKVAIVAAGVVIGKIGTSPITASELRSALNQPTESKGDSPAYGADAISSKVQGWRAAGETVVFTNGCFDLLHPGHIEVLEQSRRQGDRLVVGLNSDASTRRLKGEGRPVMDEQGRARVLSALSIVDAVVVFEEDTPIELINSIKPDVLVKGADYSEDQVVGATEVIGWGGKVYLVPLIPGQSTSEIFDRINRS